VRRIREAGDELAVGVAVGASVGKRAGLSAGLAGMPPFVLHAASVALIDSAKIRANSGLNIGGAS
jgi:hypothetical protein